MSTAFLSQYSGTAIDAKDFDDPERVREQEQKFALFHNYMKMVLAFSLGWSAVKLATLFAANEMGVKAQDSDQGATYLFGTLSSFFIPYFYRKYDEWKLLFAGFCLLLFAHACSLTSAYLGKCMYIEDFEHCRSEIAGVVFLQFSAIASGIGINCLFISQAVFIKATAERFIRCEQKKSTKREILGMLIGILVFFQLLIELSLRVCALMAYLVRMPIQYLTVPVGIVAFVVLLFVKTPMEVWNAVKVKDQEDEIETVEEWYHPDFVYETSLYGSAKEVVDMWKDVPVGFLSAPTVLTLGLLQGFFVSYVGVDVVQEKIGSGYRQYTEFLLISFALLLVPPFIRIYQKGGSVNLVHMASMCAFIVGLSLSIPGRLHVETHGSILSMVVITAIVKAVELGPIRALYIEMFWRNVDAGVAEYQWLYGLGAYTAVSCFGIYRNMNFAVTSLCFFATWSLCGFPSAMLRHEALDFDPLASFTLQGCFSESDEDVLELEDEEGKDVPWLNADEILETNLPAAAAALIQNASEEDEEDEEEVEEESKETVSLLV